MYKSQIDSAAERIGRGVIAQGCSPERAADAVSEYYSFKGISVEQKTIGGNMRSLPSYWTHTRGYDPDRLPVGKWGRKS